MSPVPRLTASWHHSIPATWLSESFEPPGRSCSVHAEVLQVLAFQACPRFLCQPHPLVASVQACLLVYLSFSACSPDSAACLALFLTYCALASITHLKLAVISVTSNLKAPPQTTPTPSSSECLLFSQGTPWGLPCARGTPAQFRVLGFHSCSLSAQSLRQLLVLGDHAVLMGTSSWKAPLGTR